MPGVEAEEAAGEEEPGMRTLLRQKSEKLLLVENELELRLREKLDLEQELARKAQQKAMLDAELAARQTDNLDLDDLEVEHLEYEGDLGDAFARLKQEMESLKGEVKAGYNFVIAMPEPNPSPSEPSSCSSIPVLFRTRTQRMEPSSTSSLPSIFRTRMPSKDVIPELLQRAQSKDVIPGLIRRAQSKDSVSSANTESVDMIQLLTSRASLLTSAAAAR
jgi:hypothetical protein